MSPAPKRKAGLLTTRDRLVVIGKTGYGKSNWVKELCAQQIELGARVVAFDPCDEYSKSGRPRKTTKLGPLEQRCTASELVDDPERFLDREDLALSVYMDPEIGDDPAEVAEQFQMVSPIVRRTGRILFIVEEVGYFEEHCRDRVKAVATLYRKEEVNAVLVAQRATQIPLTARSQASQIVSFRQDEKVDLVALEDKCGVRMPGIGARVADLDEGECVVWRDDLPIPQPAAEPQPKEQLQ